MVGAKDIVAIVLLVAWLAAGCDPEQITGSPEPSPAASTSDRISIESLDLSFELPSSFGVVETPELLFMARSAYPPGLVTIEPDAPPVLGHEAEGQETLTSVTIDGVDAVVVSDAVLEDLPQGLEARELLVANGERSFSLIMSAVEPELPRLWRRLIRSISIEGR